MCRPGPAGLLILAVAVPVLAAGCANCADDPDTRFLFETGEYYYSHKKFTDAIGMYEKTVQKCEDHFQAWIGMGHSLREYGNDLFRGVNDLVNQRKPEHAQKMFKEASLKHDEALRCFAVGLKLQPDDVQPHFGLALLCYQRSTSPIPYPFRFDDTEARRKDLERAIQEFRIVLEKVPKAHQSRRYLGLSLFAADKMDEGRRELLTYYGVMQELYDKLYASAPSGSDDQKKKRQDDLNALERDIEEVRALLVAFHEQILRERNSLVAREASLKPEEKQRSARLSRELLELEAMVEKFSEQRLGPAERVLKDRCNQYLMSVNRGSKGQGLGESLKFIAEDAAVRQRLIDTVDRRTLYERVKYKTVVIAGDSGSVGIVCDLVIKDTRKSGTPLTIRWKRLNDQWVVTEHP